MEQMTLTVKDVREYLGIGLSMAYALFHDPTFPSKRIGKKHIVFREDFHKWIAAQ